MDTSLQKHFRVVLLLAVTYCVANAQDRRTVKEPTIPPPCATLQAKLGRAGLSIYPDDENKLDTARIQAAMDTCAPGHSVVLKRASERTDAFLSGPLNLRRGVALVVDRGAFLFASRNPRDYDRTPGICGTISQESSHRCKALISGDGVNDSGVMGDGVIDGRGGEPILGQTMTWWNLADLARKGGSQNNPRLMILNHCNNFTLYRITLLNSPNFHFGYDNGNGFTVWGVKVWSPERARNTDGIDPGNSTDVTVTHSYIHTGDDQIAIKASSGAPTSHMSIVHNHFYSGHGMSIGSPTDGGASAIRVSDLSIDGSDNGLRIKSNITRGGVVQDVVFEDVCIRDTPNPILMNTSYTAHASKESNRIPFFHEILVRNVAVQGPGKVTLDGYDAAILLASSSITSCSINPIKSKLLLTTQCEDRARRVPLEVPRRTRQRIGHTRNQHTKQLCRKIRGFSNATLSKTASEPSKNSKRPRLTGAASHCSERLRPHLDV